MTASTEKEPAEEEHQESFWASFNRADAKLLLVTFAGTVAANAVTVMVVAIALISARPAFAGRPGIGTVLIYLYFVIIGALGVGTTLSLSRRAHRRWRVALVAVAVVGGLAVFDALLILLGYAVGVK